jgi:hypothetical protein
MSALPPKADIAECDRNVRFVPKAAVSRCSNGALFDHLIGEREHGLRNREAERLCRLEVDDQLVFGRLLKRQVGGFFAVENAVDIASGATVEVVAIDRSWRNDSCCSRHHPSALSYNRPDTPLIDPILPRGLDSIKRRTVVLWRCTLGLGDMQ